MENNGYTEEAEEEVGGGREGPDGFVWPADWRGQPRRLQQQQTTRDDAFTFVPDADGDDRLPHDDDVEEPAASAGQRGEDQQHQGSKQQVFF
jgi:hypothetical protein